MSFYLTGEHHVTTGRDGRLVFIWEPSRAMKYAGKFEHDHFRFVYSLFDAVDQAAGWNTWSVVITFRSMGYASVPSAEVLSIFYPLVDRFPGKLMKINVVDLDPTLSPGKT